jgi:hypothetical protein
MLIFTGPLVLVLAVVVMVSVHEPEPPAMVHALEVAPEGRLLALTVTVPVYPLTGLTLAV